MKTKNRPQIAVAGLIVLAMLLSLLSFGLFSSPALADTANDETTVQRADLPQSGDQVPDGAAKTPESGGADSQTSPADAIELLQSITPFGITPRDTGGGGGGVGGGGTWGGFELKWYFSDVNTNYPWTGTTYTQGTGATSRDREMQWATGAYPGLNQGMSGEQWNLMVSSCNDALARANQRAVAAGYPANARVIGMVWVAGAGYVWPTYGAWASKSYLTDAFNYWKANGADGVLNQQPMTRPGSNHSQRLARITTDFNEGLNSIAGANASTVCIASAPNEPEDPSYTLNLSTQAQDTFTLPGGTDPVYDTINTSRSGGSNENLTAKVTLNWDGYPSGSTAVQTVTKNMTISNNASNQKSPNFVPADLGMSQWQAGRYWYQVDVAKQGNMAAAVSHGGRNVTSETWTANGYTTTLETQAQGTFTLPGGTAPVSDQIIVTNNANGSMNEEVEATITLNWDGYPSTNTISESASKTFTIKTGGTVTSPEFLPSDLGFSQWQAGRYWYQVDVARQGNMAAAVSHGGRNVTSETWTAAGYTVSVSTQHQKPSAMVVAGSKTPIADKVIATNTAHGDMSETVQATVTMHWDGFPVTGTPTSEGSVSKSFQMVTRGETTTPTFTPTDFGWDQGWEAGQYWFDISVDRQANMSSAYNSPDRDSGEVFTLSPAAPIKTMYAEDATTPLGDGDVQTANMPVWAKVAAKAFGATQLTITDAVASTDLIIGKDGKVTTDTVFVTGPDGKKTPATITITPGKVKDPMSGKTVDGNTIKATLGQKDTSEPKLAQGTYTLNILLTPKATGSDFTAANTPTACWQSPSTTETCLEGNWKDQDKVTPKPNKAWTLTPGGALETTDPDWDNDQGADNKTFVPGDSVSAVVNGSVKAGLSSALAQYSITDNWTKANKYVDFSFYNDSDDPYLRPHVLVKMDGSSQFVDRSGDFEFSFGPTSTTATAKPGSSFLTETRGQSKDAEIKLVITGKFRYGIDTDGEKLILHNEGSETWNNETKETNVPPVYVETPKPNKVWSATEDGALVYEDHGLTNSAGSDNKTFVPGDDVWAVVNGKITKDLAQLTGYMIEDHYVESADYINFDKSTAKNGKIKIFYDARAKMSDPVKLVDVTDEFTITNKSVDKKVVAEAKLDFVKRVNTQLKATNPGFDREVRLVLQGTINPDLMGRDDEPIEIRNTGREQWNHAGEYTNTPSIFTRIPTPDKVWVLTPEGALSASDGGWTNSVGADGKTFIPGDAVSAVVNGSIPKNLAAPLKQYAITDDWTGAAKYVDFTNASLAKVYFGGVDVTDEFTVKVSGTKTIATAKPVFLARTGDLPADVQMKLVITGAFKLDAADTCSAQNTGSNDENGCKLTNSGSETWNNRTEETNEPPVFVRPPDPNKAWVLTESGALTAEDLTHSNSVGADNRTFVPGDSISAVVNGVLPKNLATNLKSYVIIDDWSDGLVKKLVDFAYPDLVRVFVDGRDRTSDFTIKVDAKKGITTATAKQSLLDTTANNQTDRMVKLVISGKFLGNQLDNDGKPACSAQQTGNTDGKGCEIVNSGSEKWNNKTVETNEPSVFIRTPQPDKVWVADENGALVYGDPDWTNSVGLDQKVFLHGDKVGAVMNGKLPKNLGQDLSYYEIADDWTDAAKYVNFNHLDQVKVYVGGKDLTKEFVISIDGTVTKAVAKSSVLRGTANMTKDVPVKLYIGGEFYQVNDTTNTEGRTIRLTNTGWEQWNESKQPSNVPPVFVWNPSPVKDVVGHGGMDGDQGSIEGQGVFPGQLIEYTITPDFNIPADTAYKITKAGVLDQFDPLFVVDKQSVEVFDGRTGKVVGRSNFDVSWSLRDVVVGGKAMTATYMELMFKPAWVEKNVDQLRQGRISVRVAGMVSELAPDGYVLVNQAWQVLNDQETPTNPPKVVIPPTTPDKEDLKCVLNEATGLFEGCDDIDGKTVLKGDKIDYRLTMDARPAASKLAYRVHKLGMVDDYDQAYLDLDTKDIRVVVKSVGSNAKNKFKVGQDVTDQFNLQVDPGTGTAYVFAKSVDTTLLTTGETIPGDPQPKDLAAYDAAPIDPLKDAGIDQDLLGNEYYVYLRATVVKETDGYVILNQARQNFENKSNLTKVVSNPLKEINPEKDVTVTVGGESINHGQVPLQGSFNYLLKSSIIPTNRAYESSAWRIVDDYNEEFDHYTGQWLVQTQTDLYDGTNLVAHAGEVIAASESMLCSYQEPAEPSNGKLAVTSSDEYQIRGTGKPGSYIYIFESTDPKQDVGQTLVEADGTWSLDYNIARQVGVNLIVEQKSEQSVTAKPTATVKTTVQAARPCYQEDNLALQGSFTVVDKDGVLTLNAQPQDYLNMINTRLDVEAGWQAFVQFDRLRPGSVTNTFTEYYNGIPREPEEVVTETPENPAINLVKYDIASGIEKGDRNSLADALKLKNKDDVRIGFLITNTGDVPLVNLELTDKTLSGSGQIKDITCEPKLEGYEFPVGGTINCEGTLTGLKWDTTHTNNATVTGESVYTGKKVTDEDPWNAIVPTGGDDSGLANTGLVGVIALTGLGLASVGAGIALTHKRRHTKQH